MSNLPVYRAPVALPHVVLGLDLGPTSLGWALVDEGVGKILATGVRIFPEGVDRDQQGGELSKNETRRVARTMRRQIARRARRKHGLREALVLARLLPEGRHEQQQLEQLDPYAMRRKALDERLEPFEIGRVLMHLNQRRGFLSNRKTDASKRKEDSETLASISRLQEEIEAAGHRTLGEHFAALRTQNALQRIRGRHTRRQMFEIELQAIWRTQATHHPKLLTEALLHGEAGRCSYPREPERAGSVSERLVRFGLWGMIFFQRPMYWPKSVIGQCELEPKEKRCPRADRAAQRFRLLNEINNLLLITPDGKIETLSEAQRAKLLDYLAKSKERTFDEIRKQLGLLESYGFNLEAGDRRKLLGMPTDVLLAGKKFFGKSWWERPDAERSAIVRMLLDGDEQEIRSRSVPSWGLSEETAESLMNLDLSEGYASYSRVALEKLLPHLERGLPLNARDPLPCALRAAGYVHANVSGNRDQLPEPPKLTNPIVRQALHEVRKVVNAILREHGKPARISIELAREVKGNAVQRRNQTLTMRDRERQREAAAERLREMLPGERPTRSKIDTYLLWQEQGNVCVYSGEPIPPTKLFGGEVNVDHVLPYSRSLDDSLMNKVVCYRKENDDKGNRTPFEWLAATNPTKYQAVLQRAAKLPIEIRNRKRPRFSQEGCELQEFISRQLVDTAYITRAVVEYVQCLGVDVLGSKGQLTAELRHQWGLNDVLKQDGLDLKNRDDHRHHAIDAIVIALTDRSRLQKLSHCRGREVLSAPWKTFRQDAETALNAINVSHRSHRKVAGALHEETSYGPTSKLHEFVYRKPVNTLTASMIESIRDPAIRELVSDRLRKFGVAPGSKSKIPADAWKEPLTMLSGTIVRKVRLLKQDETIRPLREGGQCVKPGSNHHVCIFEFEDAKGRIKREPVFVSMLEAARRVRDGEPIIQRHSPTRPSARFVMSLSRGECVLATFKGAERLVWFRTGASTQGQLYFVDHRDARADKEADRFVATANSLQARKVLVDPLGRLRWAND